MASLSTSLKMSARAQNEVKKTDGQGESSGGSQGESQRAGQESSERGPLCEADVRDDRRRGATLRGMASRPSRDEPQVRQGQKLVVPALQAITDGKDMMNKTGYGARGVLGPYCPGPRARSPGTSWRWRTPPTVWRTRTRPSRK